LTGIWWSLLLLSLDIGGRDGCDEESGDEGLGIHFGGCESEKGELKSYGKGKTIV